MDSRHMLAGEPAAAGRARAGAGGPGPSAGVATREVERLEQPEEAFRPTGTLFVISLYLLSIVVLWGYMYWLLLVRS